MDEKTIATPTTRYGSRLSGTLAFINSMFGAEVRYTGVSVGYTLSQITGSAFAPLIAVALYGAFGNTNALVIYLLAASAVSIISLLLLPGPWGRKEAARQLEYAQEKVTPVVHSHS